MWLKFEAKLERKMDKYYINVQNLFNKICSMYYRYFEQTLSRLIKCTTKSILLFHSQITYQRITPNDPSDKVEIEDIKDTNFVMEDLIPNSSYEVSFSSDICADTERFTDLGKFGFRLEPIFTTAPAASKNNDRFKSG